MAVGHVCFVILGLVVVESAVITGKALYCRDPDTGKLYAVNSTWPSSTFCGNYTCKLRKRNMTETEYTPIRQLNITNVSNETKNESSKDNITVTIEERTEPEIEAIIHKDVTDSSENKKVKEKNELERKTNEAEEAKMSVNDNGANRYLTEKEIKSISDVLQTVKKSDLDAIVDIYNLAQDIYNEMDKATNEGEVDDKVNAIVDEKYYTHGKKSYWYDPLANKGKSDMEYQGSNFAVSTTQPKPNVPTYFNGALTNQDFGKLPYYYPISPFQRTSSYVHQPTAPTNFQRPKPCKAKAMKDMQVAAQNVIKPSYLLPYPFTYVNQYNYTDYPGYKNVYYNNPYPWNYYNQQRQYQPYYNAYIAQVPNAQIPNAVLMNPHLHEDVVAEVEQKPVENIDLLGQVLVKAKENIMPDWKTEQLSSQVLDEVRANIDTSKLLKAFPFRKKLTLEKVGKLIKLDELTRNRRSTDDESYEESVRDEIEVEDVTKGDKVKQNTVSDEAIKQYEVNNETEVLIAEKEGEYETYLERTTCQTRTDPGYFRYGNLTKPYPECCPQMIKIR